jgi:hypothetical protein
VEVAIANGKTTPQASARARSPSRPTTGGAKECGALKFEQARRLKELEKENSQLKRLVAELSLEKQILQDVARGDL